MSRIHVWLADARVEPLAEVGRQIESGVTIGQFVGGLVPPVQAGGFGVWGKRVANDYVLRAGDRIEIYQPLLADPKEARRRRARNATR